MRWVLRALHTWNTVTMAQSRESKFFLSGTVSPASVFRLNLQPNMCIPRILQKQTDKQALSVTLTFRYSDTECFWSTSTGCEMNDSVRDWGAYKWYQCCVRRHMSWLDSSQRWDQSRWRDGSQNTECNTPLRDEWDRGDAINIQTVLAVACYFT